MRRRFRTFIINNTIIKNKLAFTCCRTIGVLNHNENQRGKHDMIRMDNGRVFIAHIAAEWSKMHQITFTYIQPGKPTPNAFIERFNRSYRNGVLDSYLFENIMK